MDQNPEVPKKPEELAAEETPTTADTWLPVEPEGETAEIVVETAAETSEAVTAEIVETGEEIEEVVVGEEDKLETIEIIEPTVSDVSEEEILPPSPVYEEPISEKPLQPEIMGAPGSTLPPKKSSNGWVIALVILLVLCCCCVIFIWFGVFFARVLGGVFVWIYDLVISILNAIFGGVIQFY